MKCVTKSKNGFRGGLTTLVILVIWHPKNMCGMKPNTNHSMHQIEQLSVSVSSTLAQTKVHRRGGRNLHIFIGWQPINRKLPISCKKNAFKLVKTFSATFDFDSTRHWLNICLLKEYDNKNTL